MSFTLRFPQREVPKWAALYDSNEDAAPLAVAPVAKARGHLTETEFLRLAKWKTTRTQRLCAANAPSFVKAVTATALSTPDERFRIEVLTLLSGVQWPTASVVLHFCASDPYPILDFRALWSLSCPRPPPTYKFDFWWDYCLATRYLARQIDVSMRVLDRALWQYAKTHQPAGA
ncbi:hypothetical protein [Immundisolibacter sp.]|uniref:hypothetical protein n=1 Tax=Immundisolibacter sp. TaxID=1934948 RepID=UPI0035680CC0